MVEGKEGLQFCAEKYEGRDIYTARPDLSMPR